MPTHAKTEAILRRINELVQEGSTVPPDRSDRSVLEPAPWSAWRTRCVAFLMRIVGPTDAYTEAFVQETDDRYRFLSARDKGVHILANLRGDIEGGYLDNYYLGVAGEVLADLFDLATWSLSEGSTEAAAILAGSGLELGLRRLASARSVDITKARGIDGVNDALKAAGVYGAVRHGQVNAWRLLRNHAIHGDHAAYGEAEVRLMLEGIRAFLAEQLQ